MKKNDVIELDIVAMSSEGNGIGKCNGIAVFVPNSAVGDRLLVLIVKVLKNYSFGKITEVLSPSADRLADSGCPAFLRCGGCCYRHISYGAEANAKQQRVADAMQRIGGLEVSVEPIISAQQSDRYRNKAQYPFCIGKDGKIAAGFYSLHSHIVVPCTDCQLQPLQFGKILSATIGFFQKKGYSVYDERNHKGILRHLFLRRAQVSGEIMVCIVANSQRLPFEAELAEYIAGVDRSIKSVVLNINTARTNAVLGERCRTIWGSDCITDTLCGLKIRLSPLSFYQVNHDMTEKLYSVVAELAQPKGKTVLDLYCGAGTIGLSLAHEAKQIIGVEIVPQAVENARENAQGNGIDNARFICGSADDAAKELSEKGVHADVVIVDPPRKGVSPQLIETVSNGFAPPSVVYVSCDPATLARDLKIFAQYGYVAQKIQPLDLFPRTAHVETVVLLSRK